jgi:hypothetical protein
MPAQVFESCIIDTFDVIEVKIGNIYGEDGIIGKIGCFSGVWQDRRTGLGAD